MKGSNMFERFDSTGNPLSPKHLNAAFKAQAFVRGRLSKGVVVSNRHLTCNSQRRFNLSGNGARSVQSNRSVTDR